jgi:sucrose phosphorylase
LEEIDRAVKRPVVQALFELIRARNNHPAFNGSFSMPESPDHKIALRWENGRDWVMLEADFASGLYSISSSPF